VDSREGSVSREQGIDHIILISHPSWFAIEIASGGQIIYELFTHTEHHKKNVREEVFITLLTF